jgi:predicted nucleic acid-binding protein
MIFASDILQAALAGDRLAQAALDGCAAPKICVTSRAELLALARSRAEWEQLEEFLALFETLDITAAVADRAAVLQRIHGLAWPRAMVLACAHVHELPLVSEDAGLPINDPWARPLQRPRLRVA